jgi:hypothetical protein
VTPFSKTESRARPSRVGVRLFSWFTQIINNSA